MTEMKKYTGTKTLLAVAMTLGAYNIYRGWELPSDENPEREGYLVEYPLIGKGDRPNHLNHEGYISWSPKPSFDATYRLDGSPTFGDAIAAMKEGKCVARRAWNYAGVFVFKQVPSAIKPEIVERMTSLPDSVKEILIDRGEGPNYVNQMAIVDTDSSVDSWLPTAEDIFADDWFVI